MTFEKSSPVGADEARTGRMRRAVVGTIDDFEENSMKMADVEGHTVVVIRTAAGVHALDNACPHQGYGLATGALSVDPEGAPAVTCQWHNWKFRVADGVCTLGEEDVACHGVSVGDDGSIEITVTEPTPEEERARLWPSLSRGIDSAYTGQIARDSIRLLRNGADPSEVMWAGVRIGAAKNEWGLGHELAMAADCLHLAEAWTGADQALALVQGLAGIAEESHGHPVRAVPRPDTTVDFGAAMEHEDYEGAAAWVAGAIERGDGPADIRHAFLRALGRHHVSYGHGAIYTQKVFELVDRVGWERAPELLPHLALPVSGGTREDTLPYMRKAMRMIDEVDLDALAGAPDRHATGFDTDDLADRILDAADPPITIAARGILEGAGVEGLLDAVVLAASKRLLRHDVTVERDPDANFGWLDITHAMTYARAVRWAWQHDPGPHTARLALFTAWLAFDSGRLERRHGVVPAPDPSEPMAAALEGTIDPVAEELARLALDDRGGSFIVVAHLVKTVQAAREEAAFTGSMLPLAAAARFVHAPRRERFVARSVAESLRFVDTGRPPRR